MIKTIGGANKHPTNRSLDEFRLYWAEHHGPFYAHTPICCVTSSTLRCPKRTAATRPRRTMACPCSGLPTWSRSSIRPRRPPWSRRFPASHTDVYEWYVRHQALRSDRDSMTMAQTVPIDDRQLFDRATDWPTAHRRTSVVATEQIVEEGGDAAGNGQSGLHGGEKPWPDVQEFQQHWMEVHGPLVPRLPGLRRYVQNPGVIEAYALRPMTHDGFSELWFDDLASLQTAATTPEWRAVEDDASSFLPSLSD